jgi:hypothetical protein
MCQGQYGPRQLAIIDTNGDVDIVCSVLQKLDFNLVMLGFQFNQIRPNLAQLRDQLLP